MTPALESLSPLTIAGVVAVLLLAGFWHGLIGFGFPLISTPLLALLVDFKFAVLVSIVPSLTVSTVNTFRGGNVRASLGRFWYMPLAPPIGAYLGTKLLIISPSEPFLLLLSALILFYLFRDRIGRADIAWVRAYPVAAGVLAGLVGGIFESTANVAMAPFLIYFMALGVGPTVFVQVLNLCFTTGKLAQLAAWIASGTIAPSFWLISVALAGLGLATLFAGERIRRRVEVATYMGWLRKFLWAMAVLLIAQFALSAWRWLN